MNFVCTKFINIIVVILRMYEVYIYISVFVSIFHLTIAHKNLVKCFWYKYLHKKRIWLIAQKFMTMWWYEYSSVASKAKPNIISIFNNQKVRSNFAKRDSIAIWPNGLWGLTTKKAFILRKPDCTTSPLYLPIIPLF